MKGQGIPWPLLPTTISIDIWRPTAYVTCFSSEFRYTCNGCEGFKSSECTPHDSFNMFSWCWCRMFTVRWSWAYLWGFKVKVGWSSCHKLLFTRHNWQADKTSGDEMTVFTVFLWRHWKLPKTRSLSESRVMQFSYLFAEASDGWFWKRQVATNFQKTGWNIGKEWCWVLRWKTGFHLSIMCCQWRSRIFFFFFLKKGGLAFSLHGLRLEGRVTDLVLKKRA